MISMIDPIFLFVAFIFGTIIGSFLNVVIFRFEKKESIGGRSHCPHCKKILTPGELVPLFSYLFLRGRCKNCRTPLSKQYPLVEFGMGILTVLVVGMGLPMTETALLVVLMAFLLIIVVYDFRYTIIPNTFVYGFAYFALLYGLLPCTRAADPLLCIPNSTLLAGPLLFLPLFVIWDLSGERALGLADAKLALGLGWLLGITKGITALIVGFWIGGIIGILLLSVPVATKYLGPLFALWRKDSKPIYSMRSEVPFAPFLVLAALIVLFTGFDLFSVLLP
jgi:leader peptidase (prepilin peptidase)/N-methyltransferase